jgi:hypothetical protein
MQFIGEISVYANRDFARELRVSKTCPEELRERLEMAARA